MLLRFIFDVFLFRFWFCFFHSFRFAKRKHCTFTSAVTRWAAVVCVLLYFTYQREWVVRHTYSLYSHVFEATTWFTFCCNFQIFSQSIRSLEKRTRRRRYRPFDIGCVFFLYYSTDLYENRRNEISNRSTPHSGRLITDLAASHNMFANGLGFALFLLLRVVAFSLLVRIRSRVSVRTHRIAGHILMRSSYSSRRRRRRRRAAVCIIFILFLFIFSSSHSSRPLSLCFIHFSRFHTCATRSNVSPIITSTHTHTHTVIAGLRWCMQLSPKR